MSVARLATPIANFIKLLVNNGGCRCELVNLIGYFQEADIYRFKVLTWPILNIFHLFSACFHRPGCLFPSRSGNAPVFIFLLNTFSRVSEKKNIQRLFKLVWSNCMYFFM